MIPEAHRWTVGRSGLVDCAGGGSCHEETGGADAGLVRGRRVLCQPQEDKLVAEAAGITLEAHHYTTREGSGFWSVQSFGSQATDL